MLEIQGVNSSLYLGMVCGLRLVRHRALPWCFAVQKIVSPCCSDPKEPLKLPSLPIPLEPVLIRKKYVT